MLEIEQAQELLRKEAERITEKEMVFLQDAIGRVLAENVEAERDQPPFPRSPLDGYALRAADVDGASRDNPKILQVIGKIYAGSVFRGVVGPGQAVRLMTGAPIPEGADTVIRQEDTSGGEEMVEIYTGSEPYANYCFQGEDYQAGTVLLQEGCTLDAGKISVLASIGKQKVPVYRRPQVAVISTGDEVLAPGEPWSPGKIYDSNRAYICGRLMEFGNPPALSDHVADDPYVMAEAIRASARTADFIITTGGVSVGEKDIMHETVELLGAEKLFWKVRIKPGSPTLAFQYKGVPVLCLSGNPFGAIVNFELLARPVLEKLSGQEKWKLLPGEAVLMNDYKKPAGARRFLRGYVERGKVMVNGKNQASGAIASMAECNCLVEITPRMPGARAGGKVTVYGLCPRNF